MRFEIVLAPEAVDDFRSLRASVRSTIRDALETHLRYDPTKTSRSRIKRLRGLARPRYRLRVGEIRIFYSTMYRPGLLRSWRLSPNRRLQNGWSSSESPNKGSSFI